VISRRRSKIGTGQDQKRCASGYPEPRMKVSLPLSSQRTFPFSSVKVEPRPFPHFFTEGIFADYEAVLEQIPPKADFRPFSPTKMIYPPTGFWADLAREWSRPEFIQTFLDLLKEHVVQYHGDKLDVYADVALTKSLSGYSLGPHTDLPDRVIGIVVYLPATSEWSTCGTSLFAADDGRHSDDGFHFSFDGFKCVKTSPYLPNSAFGFVRTSASFHGVLPQADFERNCLHYLIKKTGICNSVRDYHFDDKKPAVLHWAA